jgi:hypothetical protein
MQARLPVVLSLALAALTLSAVAQAGPPVQVTFKNMGSEAATYSPSGRNEMGTHTNASPAPAMIVNPLEVVNFNVQSKISPDSNYAAVRYRMGRKECQFTTTFTNVPSRGGVKVPRWKESAVASGGAICNARRLSTDYSNYGWSVEFSMM